jgi:hypothetical protein
MLLDPTDPFTSQVSHTEAILPFLGLVRGMEQLRRCLSDESL